MRRTVSLTPAALAALASLSSSEQEKISRTIKLLEHSPASRPTKLKVFRSDQLPKHFIVHVDTLRLIYHRPSQRELLIDDIFRRSSVARLYFQGGPKK
jgi:mRNA-degrading endonuclease RelE of RelBE toxin-antitoxin system